MKNLKKAAIAVMTLAAVLPALTSCKKIASNGKLDGDWTLTEASGGGTSSSTFNGTTTTGTYTISYDGTNLTNTETWDWGGGNTGSDTETSQLSLTVSFDKKEGTYTMTQVSNTTDTDNSVAYYSYDNGTDSYNFEAFLDRTDMLESTVTTDGTFQIIGGNGDIDKNSQIIFTPTSSTYHEHVTYTYYESGTTTVFTPSSADYEWDSNAASNYSTLRTMEMDDATETGTANEGDIWDVSEIKKGVMDVVEVTEDTWSDGTNSNSSTSDISMKFEQD